MTMFDALLTPMGNRPGDPLAQAPKVAPLTQPPQEIENPWDLSAMQCFVLQAAIDGKSQRQAAAETGRSVKTLETHVAHAKKKMGAATLLQACLIWDRHFRWES